MTDWHRIDDPENPPPMDDYVLLYSAKKKQPPYVGMWGLFKRFNQPRYTHWALLTPPDDV